MSEFLTRVSGEAARTRLEVWVRGSVGGMGRMVEEGFPKLFGKNWHVKMGGFPTAERPELLAFVFDRALEEMAGWIGVGYRAANGGGTAGASIVDCCLFDYEEENKPSYGRQASSFATGCAIHKTDNKPLRVLAVKVRSEDYRIKAAFGAFVDLSAAAGGSKWRTDGKNGLSTLKVAASDKDIVVPLFGSIRPGSKFIGAECEPYCMGTRRKFSLQDALSRALQEED